MPTLSDELIEDALRTYPLAEAPANFSSRVRRQIRPRHASLKFRLTWLDYALGLFLSLLPAVFFISWAFLPWQLWMRLQYQWLLLSSPAFEPLVCTVLVAAAVFAVGILVAGTRYLIRPQAF
jgi:hypothetical protein